MGLSKHVSLAGFGVGCGGLLVGGEFGIVSL